MKRLIMMCMIITLFGSLSYSQLRLTLQAGLQAPTGNLGNWVNTGYGLNITGEYIGESPISFIGSVGYNSFGAKGSLPLGTEYKFSAIPVTVGFRYYLARGDFHPYLGAELGLFFTSTDYTRLTGPTSTTTSNSETNFGFTPFGGFRYHLSNAVDLDINVKYNIITTAGGSTTFLGINAGVQFPL